MYGLMVNAGPLDGKHFKIYESMVNARPFDRRYCKINGLRVNAYESKILENILV